MAKLKTKEHNRIVDEFLNTIQEPGIKSDCYEILKMTGEITKEPPKIWGDSIIGFGNYHYKYESGREGDWFLTGFATGYKTLHCTLCRDWNGTMIF